MSRLPDIFYQDRALRNAARDVLTAEFDHARRSLSKEGLANRVTSRIGDGAKDAVEVAKEHAQDKRGLIAGFIALLALWFAREPLLEIFGLSASSPEPEAPEASETGETGEEAGTAAPADDETAHEFESADALNDADTIEPILTGVPDD